MSSNPFEDYLLRVTMPTSFSLGKKPRTVYFSAMTNDELRDLLKWRAPGLTREQLLAAANNRWRCGYTYVLED